MRKHNPDFLIAGLLVFLAAWNACADDDLPPAFQGHWTGHARITVNWCHQTNLPVVLDIHADGTVGGKIGDARLWGGHFDRNRGWLGRALHIKTDYLINAKLRGPIIAAEGITRKQIYIPLNADHAAFAGSLKTSGTVIGGKKTEVLSAEPLSLTRSP